MKRKKARKPRGIKGKATARIYAGLPECVLSYGSSNYVNCYEEAKILSEWLGRFIAWAEQERKKK